MIIATALPTTVGSDTDPKVFCDFADSDCYGLIGCFTDITNPYCDQDPLIDVTDEGSQNCAVRNAVGCGTTGEFLNGLTFVLHELP
jgi:hypothetical protein